MSTTHRQAGFTLIELLIVTIIVCILATLVGLTYSGVQSKNRNSERQANIKSLQSYLETYYAQHTQYPTSANLASAEWRKANLKDMPPDTIRDPQWSDKAECTAKDLPIPSDKPVKKCYSYEVTAADGAACDNDKNPCAQYTLTATFEGGDKFVKSSLN